VKFLHHHLEYVIVLLAKVSQALEAKVRAIRLNALRESLHGDNLANHLRTLADVLLRVCATKWVGTKHVIEHRLPRQCPPEELTVRVVSKEEPPKRSIVDRWVTVTVLRRLVP